MGPYAFCQYESERLLATIAMRAARMLEDAGFRAAAAFDLSGTGSSVGNPRGEQPDAFCNRFAAVAAGLGRLGRGGFVITPEFGPNVRFVAVVTDAELTGDPPGPAGHPDACRECRRCVEACSTRAFGGEVALAVGGSRQEFTVLDRARCDWAKRYSLVGSEGGDFTGYGVTVSAPAEIDEDSLASALRLHHPIAKYRPCNFEACVMACPLAREQPAG